MISKPAKWYRVDEKKPEDGSTVIAFSEKPYHANTEELELKFEFASYYENWEGDGVAVFVGWESNKALDFEPEFWTSVDFLPIKGEDY
jgi:hypothetical protein